MHAADVGVDLQPTRQRHGRRHAQRVPQDVRARPPARAHEGERLRCPEVPGVLPRSLACRQVGQLGGGAWNACLCALCWLSQARRRCHLAYIVIAA